MLSRVQLFATPWTVARQGPLSMGFSSREYWSGLPCPPEGTFPTQRRNPHLLCLLLWQARSLPLSHLGRIIQCKRCFIFLQVSVKKVYALEVKGNLEHHRQRCQTWIPFPNTLIPMGEQTPWQEEERLPGIPIEGALILTLTNTALKKKSRKANILAQRTEELLPQSHASRCHC